MQESLFLNHFTTKLPLQNWVWVAEFGSYMSKGKEFSEFYIFF